MIDRSEVSRAVAKAIAYKQCGKQRDAEQWAAELVRLLECANILDRTHSVNRVGISLEDGHKYAKAFIKL